MKPQKSLSKYRSSRAFLPGIGAVVCTAVVVFGLPVASIFAAEENRMEPPVTADTLAGTEHIISFNSRIEILKNSSAVITETIQYEFGPGEHHGIYRDIPFRYSSTYGTRETIRLSGISVRDESGRSVPFVRTENGDNMHIKIGEARVLVSGVKDYVIRYTAEHAVGFFTDFDEMYWNVTGNGWVVPISSARATVILPVRVAPSDVRSSCYFGAYGANTPCSFYRPKELSNEFTYVAPYPLPSFSGLTVALGFPKGIVTPPAASERFLAFVRDNWPVVLPFVVFAFMFSKWWRFGRDPKGTGVIVPEYDVPDDLTPMEVAEMVRQSIRTADISAEIIYLATKGYIRITQLEEKVLFFTTKDYRLEQLKDGADLPRAADRQLLEALFGGGMGLRFAQVGPAIGVLAGVAQKFMATRLGAVPVEMTIAPNTAPFVPRTVRLSELKKEFTLERQLSVIKSSVAGELVTRAIYTADPAKVIAKYVVIGVIGFFLTIFGVTTLLSFSFGGMLVAACIASVVIVISFAFIMPAKTKEGSLLKERILGMKLYLQIAEKDRLAFHNAPQKRPEIFEKLLPFAMALSVEKAWAKEFEGMYTQPPSWYQGGNFAAFNAVAFTHSLGDFSTSAATAASPHSHSGSGGGGFSGGGGGGGGGGSW